MKKYLIVLYCLVNIIFTSCEPDVIGEGINLPTIDVGLKVSPDTAYIQLGDTVYLTASVPTTLSNGVKLEDGKAEIALYYGYTPETPITTLNFSSPKEGGDLVYVLYKGSVNIVKDDGMLNRITHMFTATVYSYPLHLYP